MYVVRCQQRAVEKRNRCVFEPAWSNSPLTHSTDITLSLNVCWELLHEVHCPNELGIAMQGACACRSIQRNSQRYADVTFAYDPAKKPWGIGNKLSPGIRKPTELDPCLAINTLHPLDAIDRLDIRDPMTPPIKEKHTLNPQTGVKN